MDGQTSEHAPAPLLAPEINDATTSNKRGSVIQHLALLTTLLLPIAFLPYALSRSQLTSLRRKVDEIGTATAVLKQQQGRARGSTGAEAGATALLTQMRQELSVLRELVERKDAARAKSLSDLTMDLININEELNRMRGEISSVRDGAASDRNASRSEVLEALDKRLLEVHQDTQATEEQIRRLSGEQDALQSQLFKIADEVQSAKTGPHAVESVELHRLLQEARQTRSIFGAIGSSLGDVATIIQRVEIELGHERSASYDPVERLRVLALRMQEETFEGEVRPRSGRGAEHRKK